MDLPYKLPEIDTDTQIIFIIGATASGKSDFAYSLAQKYQGIIINADALQIYHDLSIVTARPDTNDCLVPHHLYGFLPVQAQYNVANWCQDVVDLIAKYHQDYTIFIVGGTGMYFNGFIKGIAQIPDIPENIRQQARMMDNQTLYSALAKCDSIAIEKLHINDTQRLARAYEVITYTGKSIYQFQQETQPYLDPQLKYQGFYLNPPRDILYARIDQRFENMIQNGAFDEVKKIMHHDLSYQAMKAVGVPEIIAYLNQETSYDQMLDKAKQASRNYAKRQITFFNNQFTNFQKIEI